MVLSVERAKQKPHKNAEPTQKHKTLICMRPFPGLFVQYFSIFLSGCKQPNLSTFRTVPQRSLSFSGCKDTQKSGYANFIFSRIRKSGLKTIFKFRYIIKKCYLLKFDTCFLKKKVDIGVSDSCNGDSETPSLFRYSWQYDGYLSTLTFFVCAIIVFIILFVVIW